MILTGKDFKDKLHPLHGEGDAVASKSQDKDGIGKIRMLPDEG